MIEDFEAWTDRLVASVTAYDDVVGLVLLGSTAATERVDAWSDHDFYLVVAPGRQEHFRTHLDWLPDVDRIVLAPRETHHGLKVLYDDGHVLEFAVADLEEVATFGGTPYRVALDRAGLAVRMGATPTPPVPGDDRTELELFLSLLVIGAGRAARGEEVSGGELVRQWGALRLVGVLARHLEPTGAAPADPYNPGRRFEARFPEAGAELGAALARPARECARALLDVADRWLRPAWPDYPGDTVDAVRRLLEPMG